MKADLVLTNCTCITMDPALPLANAIAVKGDTIVWVGNEPVTEKDTPTLDLKGAYVYPGFIDSHAHISYTGHCKYHQLDFVGISDKQTIVQMVKAEAESIGPGKWVIGFGWDDHHWKGYPSAKDLDLVANENPVALRRIDGHLVWVNSLALSLARIDANTQDPRGGKICRDHAGHPSGLLVDKAAKLLDPFIPEPSHAEIKELTRTVLRDALKYGITSIHNAATSDTDLEVYKELAQVDELPVRIYAMVVIPSELGEKIKAVGPQSFGPFLDVRCLKFFMDGAMGSRGAALFEPYADDPDNMGLIIWNEAELDQELKFAKEKGFQVAFHAIGDAANHLILNAYERQSVKNLRWRIEHAQLLRRHDIERFKSLGVIAAVQPLHLVADMPWFEARVGQKRLATGAYAFRSLLDAGACLAGGSDTPIVDSNPFWGMFAACCRKDLQGNPSDGWQSHEIISREQALKMYTIDNAYAAYCEHKLGSITAGKLADLAVLKENLLTCSDQALIDMQVQYTLINGKIVYSKLAGTS